MTKKTLLTLIIASYPLMTTLEAQEVSVERIKHLSDVMQQQGYEKAPLVAEVNALPNKVIDVDVNGKQIALAWDYLKAGDDNEAPLKAINVYAESMAAEALQAFEKAEKEKADAKAREKEQQAKVKKDKASAKNKAKKPSKNNGTGVDEVDVVDPTHEISAKGQERRCRAGQCFTKEPILINKTSFNKEQWAMLEEDPYLNIIELDINH